MMNLCKKVFLYFIFLSVILISASLNAQTARVIRGGIYQDGTSTRVESVKVQNLRNNRTAVSDGLGIFQIFSELGDSLLFSKIGYLDQKYLVQDFNDAVIKLKLSNQLREVKIEGSKKSSEIFKESSVAYSKQKQIFYGGKPPLALLSPFGGSPVTFFYELLSKSGKRVRRLNKLAAASAINEEIALRFNDVTIKRVVPIQDKDLEDFKNRFTPKLEALRSWSDFELFEYIKKSYQSF